MKINKYKFLFMCLMLGTSLSKAFASSDLNIVCKNEDVVFSVTMDRKDINTNKTMKEALVLIEKNNKTIHRSKHAVHLDKMVMNDEQKAVWDFHFNLDKNPKVFANNQINVLFEDDLKTNSLSFKKAKIVYEDYKSQSLNCELN